MKQHIRNILLFVLLICLTRCNKEHLPEFYYQCKVDGQVYKPNNCANCLTCTIYKDTIFLLGANRGFEALAIGIIDRNSVKATSYTLNRDSGYFNGGTYKNSTTVSDRFDTDSIRTGVLNIVLVDKTNKIIEGSFSFSAYNPIQNKTINVTDGKFRLHYTTN